MIPISSLKNYRPDFSKATYIGFQITIWIFIGVFVFLVAFISKSNNSLAEKETVWIDAAMMVRLEMLKWHTLGAEAARQEEAETSLSKVEILLDLMAGSGGVSYEGVYVPHLDEAEQKSLIAEVVKLKEKIVADSKENHAEHNHDHDVHSEMEEMEKILEKLELIFHANLDRKKSLHNKIANIILSLNFFLGLVVSIFFRSYERRRVMHNIETSSLNSKINHELELQKGLKDQLRTYLEESETLRLEAEISRNRAEEANKTKSEFLNVMSHELRTPLTVILGNIELLTEPSDLPDENEVAEIARDIEGSGQHLLVLINDLLDISKIEAGKMELFIEKVSLDVMLPELCKNARAYASLKNKNVEIALDMDRDIIIPADNIRLKQIIYNLLSNAIKFTDEGCVLVQVRWARDRTVFVITDTGCGISEEDIPYIFDVFRQADSSATRKNGGTGLGLAITKKLVELHGGEISVVSKLNRGTSFEFYIPY